MTLEAGNLPASSRSGRQRLKSAGNANFVNGGGSFTTRAYGYSTRSNLTSQTLDACTRTPSYAANPAVDVLSGVGCCGGACAAGQLNVTYVSNSDGLTTTRAWPTDSSGTASWVNQLAYGPNAQESNDAVFASASVGLRTNLAVYTYYTDAFSRRRLKIYPTSVSDEFFHSVDDQLLVDQGNTATRPNVSQHPLDEYVWLGGRPVAVVRGLFSRTWVRQYDWGIPTCTRLNESSASCGVYFPVTDHIGKPVLIYPTSVSDEFFHSVDDQLLVDQGHTATRQNVSQHPLDEYVWLGGRPLVIVRGLFSRTWVRYEHRAAGASGPAMCLSPSA